MKNKVTSRIVCSKISEIDEDFEMPNPKNDVCNVKSINPSNIGQIERDFDTYNKKIFLKNEDLWFENEKLMRFFKEYSEIETKFEYAPHSLRAD